MCITRLAFDVFRQEDVGVSWLGSVLTIEEAHSRIMEQFGFESHEYIIVNTQTGHRIHIDFARD